MMILTTDVIGKIVIGKTVTLTTMLVMSPTQIHSILVPIASVSFVTTFIMTSTSGDRGVHTGFHHVMCRVTIALLGIFV